MRWCTPLVWLSTLGLIGGCNGPQSALEPAGPAADIIAWLWWGMFAFFTLVLLVVTGLWLYAMQRRGEPAKAEDAERITSRWIIGGGLILPLISIAILLAAGIPAGQYLITLPSDKTPLRIDVHAHRWWWEFSYPDAGITTASQLTIPVNTPIAIHGHTDNVIHAFWVPRLGGKIDLIPGRVNTLRLQASQTGLMRGQCAEFCGTGHAHMVFQVQVLSESDFAAWQQRQQQAIRVAAEHEPAVQAFHTHCAQCHSVRGVSNGSGGPDLSGIASRPLMLLPHQRHTSTSIEQWLQTPHPRFDSETRAATSALTPSARERIAAWLETLTE